MRGRKGVLEHQAGGGKLGTPHPLPHFSPHTDAMNPSLFHTVFNLFWGKHFFHFL